MPEKKIPLSHVLFIMDGNGRWAKKRLLPRTAGHLAGVKRIREIVGACFLFHGIPFVSLFCFSSENWNRPKGEIGALFKMLKDFFASNLETFRAQGTRINVVGDLEDPKIPADVKKAIESAQEQTKDCDRFCFTVLFNYGGRQDVVQAAKKIALLVGEGKLDPASLNVESFKDYLWTKGLPDVDLLIRTSGEFRISNAYLYPLAYAELEFPKIYWPDFTKEDLAEAIEEYRGRHRRFGAVEE